MPHQEETFDELKYLLGNMGIDILWAIDKGATNFETIKLFSGVPIACIKGRVPVLLDLNLIYMKENEYFLTEKGENFKTNLKRKI